MKCRKGSRLLLLLLLFFFHRMRIIVFFLFVRMLFSHLNKDKWEKENLEIVRDQIFLLVFQYVKMQRHRSSSRTKIYDNPWILKNDQQQNFDNFNEQQKTTTAKKKKNKLQMIRFQRAQVFQLTYSCFFFFLRFACTLSFTSFGIDHFRCIAHDRVLFMSNLLKMMIILVKISFFLHLLLIKKMESFIDY